MLFRTGVSKTLDWNNYKISRLGEAKKKENKFKIFKNPVLFQNKFENE